MMNQPKQIASSILQKDLIYKTHLKEIKNITFTKREADIISCVLHNRGEKKIARILNMSPRTVGTHKYNIMQKLRCNSRDYIIDFVEQAGLLKTFLQYYVHLLIEDNFREHLRAISRKINPRSKKITIEMNEGSQKTDSLQRKLKKELESAKIYISEVKGQEEMVDEYASSILSNITDENYYSQAFVLLKHLFAKSNLDPFYQEFLNSSEVLFNNSQQDKINNSDSHSIGSKSWIFATKRRILIIAMILLSLFTIGIFFTREDRQGEERSIIALMSQLNNIGQQISANNLHAEFYQKNNSLVLKLERIIYRLDNQALEKYFRNSELPAEELIAAIYALNSLASFYLYNNNDYKKAIPILLKAKNLAENYLKSRCKIKLDFDKMTPAECFSELSSIENLPIIYTYTNYFLGRSYFYLGDVEKSKKYFNLAEIIGNKSSNFIAFLSKQQGLSKILDQEAKVAHEAGTSEKAMLIFKKLYNLYRDMLNDNHEYSNNHNPVANSFTLVVPSKQPLARITTLRQMAKYSMQLMILEPVEKNNFYQQIYESFAMDNGILDLIKSDKIIGRHKAASLNLLADILLECRQLKFSSNRLELIIQQKLDIQADNSLNLIAKLYQFSRDISKRNDFTKADSLNGLIKLELLKGEQKDEALIKKYTNDRNDINSFLNRTMFEVFLYEKTKNT